MKSTNSADRIASLPEELIHHILSFLDMKEVVQLCVLSRKWRYLWKSLSTITMSDVFWPKYPISAMEDDSKFKKFIDKILILRHNHFDIKKFYLAYCPWGEFNYEFDRWIDLVLRRNVEDIHLERLHDVSKFSIILLANHVNTLKLTSLEIMDDDDTNELSLTCSTLESLVLDECYYGCDIINISAPQLKYLTIRNSFSTLPEGCSVKVDAPNLTLLQLKDYIFQDCTFVDFPCLVDAHIDTKYRLECQMHDTNLNMLGNSLIHLLKQLANVRSLTLSLHALQTSAEIQTMLEEAPISFLNLRYLKLTGWHTKGYIHAVAKLFASFSCIETLVLEPIEKDYISESKDEDWSKQLEFECGFCKLKSVEIKGLEGCDNELKFLEFLLKNALVLENISITATEALSSDSFKMSEFSKKLQFLPRASSSVAIFYLLDASHGTYQPWCGKNLT